MLTYDDVASLIAAPMIAMGAGPISLLEAFKLAHDICEAIVLYAAAAAMHSDKDAFDHA